jgi:hypothetical protein
LAALSLIDNLLWEKAGQPQLPATAEKIARYRAMLAKLTAVAVKSAARRYAPGGRWLAYRARTAGARRSRRN